ncbi:MAG: diadenylate cyclase CdaA [Thermodesulfobacteriota bacterium]
MESILDFRYFWDTLDIVLVAFIFYYILKIIEGTRAAQILFGLAVVVLLFFASQSTGLFTLNWVLNHFLGSIILIIVILFQNDIRKALANIGKKPLLLRFGKVLSEEETVDELVKASTFLASRKIGALIAVERNSSLEDFIELGMKLDAQISRELIISIFNPSSPLHDGGIIIGENKILSAGSFFPLETDPDLERSLGTRHRAAIGLSSETDAVVIVVSEETGLISLAIQGEIKRGLDATSLFNNLADLLNVKPSKINEEKYYSKSTA